MACDQFDQDRLTALEARIKALEAALAALDDPTVVSYTLDSGQGRQVATRADIGRLEDSLEKMLSNREALKNRCTGGGVVQVVPAW